MPNLTLKNVPADVHRRLKVRARRHRTSLNREAIECLREATSVARVDIDALLARVREIRGQIKGKLTDAGLARMKIRGRP